MTTSVRFCFSYDPLKLDFIAFKMDNISSRKRIADTDVGNDVTCRAKVLLHVWSYDFYYQFHCTGLKFIEFIESSGENCIFMHVYVVLLTNYDRQISCRCNCQKTL